MYDPITSNDLSINAYLHHVFSSYRPASPTSFTTELEFVSAGF